MTKDWCEQKKKEYVDYFINLQIKTLEGVDAFNLTTIQEKYIKELVVKKPYLVQLALADLIDITQKSCQDWLNNSFKEYCEVAQNYEYMKNYYDEYVDSEIIELDGDVLITDPCYIIDSNNKNDWENTDYGDHLENVGITNFVTHRTLFGDWSCTMYDTETEEEIGEFCADAGLVSIINLNQAMNYNKTGVKALLEKNWCATVIKNFKGTGQIKVNEVQWEDEETKELHTDYEAYVELIGVDKTTNKVVRYFSQQTGF